MPLLSNAWTAVNWGRRNLTPFTLSGKGPLLCTTALAGGAALSLLAPPAAFAAAAANITATAGIAQYAGAGLDLAWEGAKVATNIATAVGGTLPAVAESAVMNAQAAASAVAPT